MSTALTFLHEARHRLNLTVRGDVLARRILFDGNRAVGVEVDSGGEIFEVRGREIILSGGTINSAQLLMLSGIGPADHLRELGIPVVSELPGVGENLRDHPMVSLLFETEDLIPKDAPPLQIGMRYTTPGSEFRNDMQLRPVLITTEDIPVDYEIDSETSKTGFSIALQKAYSVGRLRLTSADPGVQPLLEYRYLTDPRDAERLRGAVRLCVQLTEGAEYQQYPLTRIAPKDDDLSSDEALDRWLLSNVMTQHHSSGTCKMGPDSDPMAVVDQYCLVRGVEGLRVVDASIMPDVVRANTNATTIMIADRFSAWIDQAPKK